MPASRESSAALSSSNNLGSSSAGGTSSRKHPGPGPMRLTRRQTFPYLSPVCPGGFDLPGHMALVYRREEGSSRAPSQRQTVIRIVVGQRCPPFTFSYHREPPRFLCSSQMTVSAWQRISLVPSPAQHCGLLAAPPCESALTPDTSRQRRSLACDGITDDKAYSSLLMASHAALKLDDHPIGSHPMERGDPSKPRAPQGLEHEPL